MSLYAVKNDEGSYLAGGDDALWSPRFDNAAVYNKNVADRWSAKYGGHMVELVEAPAKVVVSQKEAEMLERAHDENYYAVNVLRNYIIPFDGTMPNSKFEAFSDRLMRAYVNGWEVEKPKRFVLPMPVGLEGESWRAMHIAIREKDEGWYGSAYHYDITASETPSYTQADIDAAPAWVKAIKPVEVKDNE